MSSQKQSVTVKDLVDEAKKRIVLLIVCVVGLSYLMSLTSSSVLVNLPAAGLLIIILRYFSFDLEMRRKAVTYKSKAAPANSVPQRRPLDGARAKTNDWKQKVNSPVVEDAIDHFTRHIVSEWVTDLWYSRITPDRQGPEELVQIMNGVLAEISWRSKNINLINLLTRDIIGLICTSLELFRASKVKIEKQQSRSLTIEELDVELKYVLAAENKLHPALFSPEAEHKVLRHLMDGLISLTFNPEDLQCSLFRYIVRELLACVVVRPVLNLASPRFINERIESVVISLRKSDKGSMAAEVTTHSKENGLSEKSPDHFSPFPDPSINGVELVQLKKDQLKPDAEKPESGESNGTLNTRDPLLCIDTRSTRSWSSLASEPQRGDGGLKQHQSGGEWGDMLDVISRRKTEALAPQHFDDMWAKGRNYKRKEGAIARDQLAGVVKSVDHLKASGRPKQKGGNSKDSFSGKGNPVSGWNSSQGHALGFSFQEEDKEDVMISDDTESKTSSSYTTEDEEIGTVMGLDTPGVKVWDGKNRRNVNQIHHPLENFDSRKTRKTSKGYIQRMRITQSNKKKLRLNSQKGHYWQEVERTSFLLGDGQDILNTGTGNIKHEDSSDDSEAELLNRISSGATASSCVSSASLPEGHAFAASFPSAPIISDSFWKLRCEVLGANVVKSGSRTFAVYSISVTDVNNNTWSIKRRFRHFEELHQRLKEFPEYNLHLPPKHFLSTGLDVFVIQERCKLLDKYLKELLQLPTVSGSIEVWDFLSVDSQTYLFSNPLSIVETLSVDLGDATCQKKREHQDHLPSAADHLSLKIQQSALQMKHEHIADGPKLTAKNVSLSPPKTPAKEGKASNDSSSESDDVMRKKEHSTRNSRKTVKAGDGSLQGSYELFNDGGTDPTLPSEWVPPNLSLPILDLVDVIFQLQDGGWIRRKALWVAKQVLQLGMGDAFDDWLIEKIRLLRTGSVVASGIKRLEQILWPDGIFITKHPRRQQPTPAASPSYNSPRSQPSTPLPSALTEDIRTLEEIQKKEAGRRAKLVYELMIDKAPAAIVSLVGRKEYEQRAKDLYYFIQSSVCIKKLVLDLLELLLLSAFPELDGIFRQLHEEKEKFGEYKRSPQTTLSGDS